VLAPRPADVAGRGLNWAAVAWQARRPELVNDLRRRVPRGPGAERGGFLGNPPDGARRSGELPHLDVVRLKHAARLEEQPAP